MSAAMAVKWHRECLKSRKESLRRKETHLAECQADVDRLRRSAGLLEAQIDLAEKDGKDKFDADRYAINRLCL